MKEWGRKENIFKKLERKVFLLSFLLILSSFNLFHSLFNFSVYFF